MQQNNQHFSPFSFVVVFLPLLFFFVAVCCLPRQGVWLLVEHFMVYRLFQFYWMSMCACYWEKPMCAHIIQNFPIFQLFRVLFSLYLNFYIWKYSTIHCVAVFMACVSLFLLLFSFIFLLCCCNEQTKMSKNHGERLDDDARCGIRRENKKHTTVQTL